MKRHLDLFLALILFGVVAFSAVLLGQYVIKVRPVTTSYEVYRDVLSVVLTVAGIVIAVVGVGIYLIISRKIEADTRKIAREERHKGSVSVLMNTAYGLWLHYDECRKKNTMKFLVAAFDLTKQASEESVSVLDERDLGNELLICEAKNNLGYYAAKRRGSGDRALALACADYIEKRIGKFPGKAATWEDTITAIRETFPAEHKPKGFLRRLFPGSIEEGR